jgi:anti-anti-sigma factor
MDLTAVATAVADGSVIVTLTGAFDAFNEQEILHCFRALDAERPVVLDMAATTFIDSVTLALLVETCRRGVHLSVRNASPFIDKVLTVSGVSTLLA